MSEVGIVIFSPVTFSTGSCAAGFWECVREPPLWQGLVRDWCQLADATCLTGWVSAPVAGWDDLLHTGLPKAVILTAVPKRLRRKVLGDWVSLGVG